MSLEKGGGGNLTQFRFPIPLRSHTLGVKELEKGDRRGVNSFFIIIILVLVFFSLEKIFQLPRGKGTRLVYL